MRFLSLNGAAVAVLEFRSACAPRQLVGGAGSARDQPGHRQLPSGPPCLRACVTEAMQGREGKLPTIKKRFPKTEFNLL